MSQIVFTKLQLEYDNTEGMILLSELSRRRIRSVQKLIRVGRNEVVVVLRVDKEKGPSTSAASLQISQSYVLTHRHICQVTLIYRNVVYRPRIS